MIPFHSLTYLLPASALALAKASLNAGEGGAPLLGGIRETVLEHFRQVKADWGGNPDIAEQIYRIVNSGTGA
jgi:hypothetical protein